MQNKKAFTLIELLIVVAIIAILAAIALPNFLEAQTRSKVARVKSDLRTMATALEAYRVDSNSYPHSYVVADALIEPRIKRLSPLTTPLAYMTSIPPDIFSRDKVTTYSNEDIRVPIYTDKKSYARFVTNAFGTVENGRNVYRLFWRVDFPQSEWVLRSRGPRGTAGGIGETFTKLDAYDPTNGTISNGNITYVGPGVGFLGRN